MEDKWFEKIEDYLSGKMNREDKVLFEKALASNQELASVFNVYRTVENQMQAHENKKPAAEESELKKSLQALNTRYFEPGQQELKPAKTIKLAYRSLYKYTTMIAASIMLALVAYFIVFQVIQTPQNLARKYIGAHLLELSQQIDSSRDSLKVGIEAYNKKEYEKALEYFRDVYKNHPRNSEAKKNIGLVYLATKRYDEAADEFDELAQIKNLNSNPGMFLKALTLMRRNKQGDKEEARRLLQQVVNEKSEGYQEAQEWLDKLY